MTSHRCSPKDVTMHHPNAALAPFATLPSEALALLAPITTNEQLTAKLEAIESLMSTMGQDARHPLRPLFALLSDQVAAYENAHVVIPDSTPQHQLAYLIEAHSVTQSDVARATGIQKSNLSKLLDGTRTPSKKAAVALGAYFHVSPAVFL